MNTDFKVDWEISKRTGNHFLRIVNKRKDVVKNISVLADLDEDGSAEQIDEISSLQPGNKFDTLLFSSDDFEYYGKCKMEVILRYDNIPHGYTVSAPV